MPQLPSGRHVAIHAGPFERTMQKVSEYALMREVVKMETIADVLNFVDVIFLEKADTEIIDSEKYSIADGSFIPPPGFIALNTGFTLSNWKELANDWSDEDRAAMLAFLKSDRCNSYLRKYLDAAKSQEINFDYD